MNKKIIGIAVIIIGLIALIGFIYFMFFYNFSSGNSARTNKNPVKEAPVGEISGLPSKQPAENSSQRAVINIKKQNKTENKVTEEDLKRMAASFAERFGSFSNQVNYGNINDLRIFMSVKMKNWADRFIKKETAKNVNSGIYYGITTKAIAEQVNQFNDDSGRAQITVSAQRREAVGALGNAVGFQQDIIINFIKENGIWKVDSAVWQKK